MAIKKNTKRKYAALGLALVGVAGLSVASAAHLNVDAGNEVLFGSDTFSECQSGPVSVSYGYNSAYQISDVTVTDISAACATSPIKVELENAAGSTVVSVSGTLDASGTFTGNVNTPSVHVETDLGDAVVVIG